jgi:hypothetical protein
LLPVSHSASEIVCGFCVAPGAGVARPFAMIAPLLSASVSPSKSMRYARHGPIVWSSVAPPFFRSVSSGAVKPYSSTVSPSACEIDCVSRNVS